MRQTMWETYQEYLIQQLNLSRTYDSTKKKGDVLLESNLYNGPGILKARETIIKVGETDIYNNIVYPNTGKNLPCFGMDFMCFFEQKVIIVFDFQHPTPHYDFRHPIVDEMLNDMLDNTTKGIRFFEPGNHFSRYIYVRHCTRKDIPDHLESFKRYIDVYTKLIQEANPVNEDIIEFKEFDQYMLKLDPVSGYMASKFDKQFAEDYVNNFLFSYANK